ncbi:hypothetical protein GCM10027048_27580 [Hymenobacter coalescens]
MKKLIAELVKAYRGWLWRRKKAGLRDFQQRAMIGRLMLDSGPVVYTPSLVPDYMAAFIQSAKDMRRSRARLTRLKA